MLVGGSRGSFSRREEVGHFFGSMSFDGMTDVLLITDYAIQRMRNL
jgi:hypothetical protein